NCRSPASAWSPAQSAPRRGRRAEYGKNPAGRRSGTPQTARRRRADASPLRSLAMRSARRPGGASSPLLNDFPFFIEDEVRALEEEVHEFDKGPQQSGQ